MKIFGRSTLLTAALFLGLGFAAAQTEGTTTETTAEPTTITLPSGALTLPGLSGAEVVANFTTVLGGGVIYRGSVADAVDRYAQALTAAGFTAEGTSAATATAGTTDAAATTTTDAAAGTAATTGTTDTAAATTTTGTTDTSTAASGTTGTTGTGTAATGTTTTGTTATGTAATGTTTTGTTDTSTAAAGTTTTTDTAAAGTTDAAATTDATAAAAGTGATATTEGPTGLPDGPVQTFVRGGERIQVRAYERAGLTIVVISRLGAAATGTTTSGG